MCYKHFGKAKLCENTKKVSRIPYYQRICSYVTDNANIKRNTKHEQTQKKKK